jgi:hypothetical protein
VPPQSRECLRLELRRSRASHGRVATRSFTTDARGAERTTYHVSFARIQVLQVRWAEACKLAVRTRPVRREHQYPVRLGSADPEQ